MNPMTSEGPSANSVFVMAPHSGYSMIPGSTSQVPQNSFNQPQVHAIHGNPSGLEQPMCTGPVQRSLKEGKVLGAIQILIGLIHIGLGSILGNLTFWYYTAISFFGGYPFWGGILFIISGAFSVASEKQPQSSCLLKGSMGLNIGSAICSVIGIMLLITDMILNSPTFYYHGYYSHSSRFQAPGVATSALLFIFSLLELCIACTSAHFGCKLDRHLHYGTVVYQTVYVTNPVANPERVNSPPAYSSEVQDSK